MSTTKGPALDRYFRLAMKSANRTAFAARLNELCDMKNLAVKGEGRYTQLAKALSSPGAKISYQGVKKWLDGDGYPSMDHALAIANWADVNLLWLLQGTPPMRGERIDPNAAAVAEAISAMPREERQATLEFARFQLHKSGTWFAEERRARYLDAIDHLSHPEGTASSKTEKHAAAA